MFNNITRAVETQRLDSTIDDRSPVGRRSAQVFRKAADSVELLREATIDSIDLLLESAHGDPTRVYLI